MYNVIIFGTGQSAEYVENVLNTEVNVVVYADNDKDKWNSTKEGKLIIKPDLIPRYNYDFIIIGSQFSYYIYKQLLNIGIKEEKILDFYLLLDSIGNEIKFQVDNVYNVLQSDVEVLITGISYASVGINDSLLKKQCYKLAFRSQDLYYDFKLVEYILNKYNTLVKKVKKVIIGLSYYSFQYDMSLSSMRYRVNLYNEVLNDCHNLEDLGDMHKRINNCRKIANIIFRKNPSGTYDFIWKTRSVNNRKADLIAIGKKQAEIDCDKNYPKTVVENIIIFTRFIKFLKDRNIEPIVVVFPGSIYYTRNFSKRIEDEFFTIINKTKVEYGFQYIDFFRSELFMDEDFSDVTHLNAAGANKFTNILNEIINW